MSTPELPAGRELDALVAMIDAMRAPQCAGCGWPLRGDTERGSGVCYHCEHPEESPARLPHQEDT